MVSTRLPNSFFTALLALGCVCLLVSACSNAELTQRLVSEPAEKSYHHFDVKVALSNYTDSQKLRSKLTRELQRYRLHSSQLHTVQGMVVQQQPATALIEVIELERHIETVEYHRSYGRTSLTRMRGQKTAETPVITMRARLIDQDSKRTVFAADYVNRGPWYADSTRVVAALAGRLVAELEREGFIKASK